jgi:hypothetical protein
MNEVMTNAVSLQGSGHRLTQPHGFVADSLCECPAGLRQPLSVISAWPVGGLPPSCTGDVGE